MHIGIIFDTDESEKIWNGFRFASTAMDRGHTVEAFLLGSGVKAPELEDTDFNPHGLMVDYKRNGGKLYACGTCMDHRDLSESELRPRSTMVDLVKMAENADKLISIG